MGSVHVTVDGKEIPETESGTFAPDYTLPHRTYTFGERERHVLQIKVDF